MFSGRCPLTPPVVDPQPLGASVSLLFPRILLYLRSLPIRSSFSRHYLQLDVQMSRDLVTISPPIRPTDLPKPLPQYAVVTNTPFAKSNRTESNLLLSLDAFGGVWIGLEDIIHKILVLA